MSERTLRLPASEAAPEAARRWMSGLLGRPGALVQDAQLLLSELVTNCLRHAGLAQGDLIEVSVRRPPPTLRVEVRDQGRGFEPPADPRLPPPSQAAGRGLFIVSRVADRWGIVSGRGTRAWFEIDASEDAGPPAAGGPGARL